MLNLINRFQRLDRLDPCIAGPDADRVLHRNDKDLAVADGPGPAPLADRVNNRLAITIFHHDLDLLLGQELDAVLSHPPLSGNPFLLARPMTSLTVMLIKPFSSRAILIR